MKKDLKRNYKLPSEVCYDSLSIEELIQIIIRGSDELKRLAWPESHGAAWAIEIAALRIGNKLFHTDNKPDEWC